MNPQTVQQRRCRVEGCGRKRYGGGLCRRHYERLHRHGTSDYVPKAAWADGPAELKIKLFSRRFIRPDSGCWEWTGHRKRHGYGAVRYRGREVGVHRASAHIHFGFDLASPLLILHACDNPVCFNPDHLRPGTNAENALDRARKGRGRPRGPVMSADQVRRIRGLLRSGATASSVASQFGLNLSTVRRIKSRKIWKDVE